MSCRRTPFLLFLPRPVVFPVLPFDFGVNLQFLFDAHCPCTFPFFCALAQTAQGERAPRDVCVKSIGGVGRKPLVECYTI